MKNVELKKMEAETPKEFFEKTLQSRFKPEKAKDIDVIAQLNITGPDGGEWIVVIKDQKLQVKEGTDPESTLTLNINEKDFMDIINEKLSAEKAFFTGRIKFKGSIAVALKMKDAGFL